MSTPPTPTGPDQSDPFVSARENLSLVSIDAHRDPAILFEIILASCYAARAGHSNITVYRFITALVMTGNLASPGMWAHVLQTVMDLEAQDRQERNPTS